MFGAQGPAPSLPYGPPPGGKKAAGSGNPPLADLPPHLKIVFESDKVIEFKRPLERKELPPYSGIAGLLSVFETTPPPPVKAIELPVERKQNQKETLINLHKEKLELLASDWDPHNNSKATENAYLTLFIGRLSYETTEKKLRREFEQYGPIRSIRLVSDLEGKSRGYAFIEFMNEADMTAALRKTEGKKLDGRKIICDVERGRTVRNWKPMRFGGGLGGRQAQTKTKEDVSERIRERSRSRDRYVPKDREYRREGRSRSRERERKDSRDRYDHRGGVGGGGGGYGGGPPREVRRDNSRDRRGGAGLGYNQYQDRSRDSYGPPRGRSRDRR